MATEEEKKAAQAVRDGIKVTQNNSIAEVKAEGESEDNEQEQNNDNEENEEGEKEDNKGTEEGSEEENDEKEEGEEAEERVETKSVEKLEKTIARLQKRIDKKSGSEKQLQKQLDDLKAQLEAKQAAGETVLTEEDVNTRAERLAAERLAEREFTRACNKLAEAATKIDKEFDTKVKDMGEEIGPIPSVMIGILEDLDNGGAVLAHLVNNVDDAEELYALPLPKMSLRLAKLSEKLAAKPKREISKVPAPNEPVTHGRVQPAFDPRNTKMDTKEWIEKRNQQVAERRKARQGGM